MSQTNPARLHPWCGLRDVSDVQSLATLGVVLALLAAGWAGFLPWWCWPVAPLGAYLAYVINHNHQHLTIWRAAAHHPANHVTGIMFSLAMGYPGSAIVPLHNRNHHAANNRPEDFMWTGHARFRRGWLNLLTYPLVAALAYRGQRAAAHRACAARDPRWALRLRSERLALLLLSIAALLYRSEATLLWLLLPWLLGQFWVINANFLQHHGCDPEDPQGHARCMTGWLNRLIFNGGWHLAHHARPTLHWRLLPATGLASHHARRSLVVLLWELARART